MLNDRFPDNPKRVDIGLAIFDSSYTKAIVPDPRLRAALVALQGTAGEPSIAGILGGAYSTVRFGVTPTATAAAQVIAPQAGSDKPDVVFNQRYQYEDFKLLAPVMGHEALHREVGAGGNSTKEELAAGSIEALVYGQFLLESPKLATSGTELTRFQNTELMARINTRDANGNLRLFTSQGNIFPGGNFVPYYAAPFEPLGKSTPGNKVLKGEVKKVVGENVRLPEKVDFNDRTVLLLDSRQRVFTPAEVVQLAEILKLDTSPPSSTAAARRAQEEAEASDQPVPDWREIFGAE